MFCKYVMSCLTSITIELTLGDRVLVGKNRKPAEITKIEYFERTGEIVIGTTAGKRRLLTVALENNGNVG